MLIGSCDDDSDGVDRPADVCLDHTLVPNCSITSTGVDGQISTVKEPMNL